MNKNKKLPIVPMDQIPQSEKSEPPTPTPSSKGVFIKRAREQSWEEFKEAVIQKFRDAGMTDPKGGK